MTEESRLRVLPQQLPRPHDARTLRARPEEFPLVPRETAVIVVDMQNAYASPGGYIDIQGFDVSAANRVTERILRVIATARAVGSPIVFFQNGWEPGRHEAGTPDSPNYWKSNALKLMRADPKLDGTLITRGTWDYELVAELKPEPEDIVLNKTRYSGFWGTPLDAILRARRIRNLLFVGIATNVCVESTLRDAYFLEYFPILIEDATLHAGPPEMQAATVFNVEKFFGWVTTTSDFCALTNR
jgi:ureidoacrylate peracid hydrolase